MSNCNFDDKELCVISNNLPKGTSYSINKCGNVAIRHKKAPDYIFFNIYKRPDGYIIRKRLSVAQGCSNVGGVMNRGNSFSTINEAMCYLNNYATKYPKRMYARAR